MRQSVRRPLHASVVMFQILAQMALHGYPLSSAQRIPRHTHTHTHRPCNTCRNGLGPLQSQGVWLGGSRDVVQSKELLQSLMDLIMTEVRCMEILHHLQVCSLKLPGLGEGSKGSGVRPSVPQNTVVFHNKGCGIPWKDCLYNYFRRFLTR